MPGFMQCVRHWQHAAGLKAVPRSKSDYLFSARQITLPGFKTFLGSIAAFSALFAWPVYADRLAPASCG